MAVILFVLLSLGIGMGLMWVLKEIIFLGKWGYFIYFLAGFLPIYITVLSLVYLVTGSKELVSLFQILKEFIVLISFLVFLFFQKKPEEYPFRLQSTDWLTLAFLSLGFLYLLLPLGESSFLNKGLYYKNMLIPAFVYFLGRNSQFEDWELHRLFKIIFTVAISCFVLNLAENFIFDAHLQQFTGYAGYNHGINDIEPSGNFGLSWTFETQAITKRLAGFFSDPLEMASSVLMGFSAGLIWFLTTRKEYHWLYLCVMACSLGSLVFSSSRAAFGAFFILIFFVAIVFKLYKLIAAGFLAVLAFGLYVLFFASEDFYYFVIDTLTFENASSAGHVVEWLLALESMISSPLGIGLAMSGNVGGVSEELRVGGENQFLIYGVQLGWLGLILYCLILLSAVRLSLKVFYTTDEKMTARIAFVGAVTKVGMLLPLFTANAEMYSYVSWISWWMLGYSVYAYSRLKSTYLSQSKPV